MHSINKYQVNDLEFNFIEVKQKNIQITFMDYGATVLSIYVPDKDGKMETVLLAYDKLTSYINNEMYLNSIIGPTSGRIKNGEFELNELTIKLDKNFLETENLHGGFECFGFKFFNYEILDELSQTQVRFIYRRMDADSKLPGNSTIQIIYTVSESELQIEFLGDTTEDTLLNLTSHMYFNLSGDLKNTVLNHKLQINASKTIELDDKFVPYKVKELTNTHLDFLSFKHIKDNFFEGIYDLPVKGIDNPYMLDNIGFDNLSAKLYDPISGRKMEVYTTYPSIVVYTHNFPDDNTLLFNRKHEKHLGICFETQNPPNGINIPNLESSILLENEEYYHKTLYKFKVEDSD